MPTDIAKTTTSYLVAEDRSWLGSDFGTTATRSGTLDVSTLVSGTHYDATDKLFKSGSALVLNNSSGLWEPWTVGGDTSEVQTFTRTSTGGTVTVTLDGETTAAIAATAAGFTNPVLKAALEGLANVNPGDVTVTGSAGGPLVVTFVAGPYAGVDAPTMTVDNTSATGGTITVATTTAGDAGNGTEVGVLWSTEPVGTHDVGIAVLEHGVIRLSKLPVNSGVDALFKAAVKASANCQLAFRP